MVSGGKFAVDVVAKSRELCILKDTWVLSDVRERIGMAFAGRLEDHRMRGTLPVQTANSFHIRPGNHITNACLVVLVPRKPTIRGLPELLDREAGKRLRFCETE